MYMPPPAPMKSIIENPSLPRLLIFKGLSLERAGFFVPILGIGRLQKVFQIPGKYAAVLLIGKKNKNLCKCTWHLVHRRKENSAKAATKTR